MRTRASWRVIVADAKVPRHWGSRRGGGRLHSYGLGPTVRRPCPSPHAPLLVAAAVWPVSHVVFQALSRGTTWSAFGAYVAGNILYWLALAALVATFLGRAGVARVLRAPQLSTRKDAWLAAMCVAMALPPLGIVFVANAPRLTAAGWALLLGSALCNGVLEELFWRGVFVDRFSDVRRAYALPTVFFTLWHLTLAALPGMHYHGGWGALVGGAAGFGLVWGYAAWKLGSVRFAVVGHVLVNVFAFSGLIVDNWPP